jgi:hypothetical protein
MRQPLVLEPVHDLRHRISLHGVPLIAETVIEQVQCTVDHIRALTVGQ